MGALRLSVWLVLPPCGRFSRENFREWWTKGGAKTKNRMQSTRNRKYVKG